MRIDQINEKYLDRLELYQREIESFDHAGRTPDEFISAFVQHYRDETTRFRNKVVPDEGSAYEVNPERMLAIAWQHNEHAWRRMQYALQAGFGSLSGYVDARAEASAMHEWATNMHEMATDGWLPDTGARIPNR